MIEKTGYSLSRAWFDWAFENPDKARTIHTALYMWLIEKWNRVGQKEKFSVTTSESMEVLAIKSRNTYSKAFNELIEFGFIAIITKSNNQNSTNVISLAQKISKQKDSRRTALDTAVIQAEGQQEDNNRTINKPITNNQETIKQLNNYQLFVDIYNEFCKKILNVPAKINGSEGKAMKEIIAYVEKVSAEKKSVPSDSWQFILDSYSRWDEFHQKQIKLVQINSNLPNIINSIKNGKQSKSTNHEQNHNELADLAARARAAKDAIAHSGQ